MTALGSCFWIQQGSSAELRLNLPKYHPYLLDVFLNKLQHVNQVKQCNKWDFYSKVVIFLVLINKLTDLSQGIELGLAVNTLL